MKYSAEIMLTLVLLGSIQTLYVKYPEFKQIDEKWSSHLMGSKTLAQLGCLVTCFASILNHRGVKIDGQEVTPASLNAWIKKRKGYNKNLLIWGTMAELGLRFAEFNSSLKEIKEMFDKGHKVILFVDHRHWVLMKGYTDEGFHVMDPGYWKVNYYRNSRVSDSAVLMTSDLDKDGHH